MAEREITVRQFWNGQELTPDNPELLEELREHQQKIVQGYFDALCRSDMSKAREIFKRVEKRDDGTEVLTDW